MSKKKVVSNVREETMSSGAKTGPLLFLAACVLFLGFFYLYQVNSLATLGFEVRSLEKKITELEKESKKMQIKEVELRSMYNIEKSTEDLNLVTPQNISYVEFDGSFAMR